MIKQMLQIAGVRNEKEFLAKYPTEASFFNAHPEARQLANQLSGFTPNYSDTMPQAMYGMGMAYGGYTPIAADGMQVQDPPRQEDYPDYGSYNAAYEAYLASMQQQADASEAVPQNTMNAANVPINKFNLKNYQGVSIADFLSAQGKPSDFSSRKELANSLGISNYRGTAGQNKQMMQMLQQNPNILSDYNGMGQPTGGFKKAASASRNVKGAPNTESLADAKQAALIANRPTQSNTSLQGASFNPFAMPDMSNNLVRRDINTGRMVANMTGPMMSVENAKRMQLADQMNRAAEVRASGQPMISQGFAVGGAYLPDYADSAYGLPQFELGAPIYADGGMSAQGGGQEQQIMQQVAQALQQGAQPEQVMEQLVQMGISQDQAQQLIQIIMQQMQGGVGQQPSMQMYGGAYKHGGYYGNVPQHGNPGVYADGTSGTSSAGQSFEYGGLYKFIGGGDPSEEMMPPFPEQAPSQGGGGGQGQFDQQQVIQAVFQMLQEGIPPEQIMQQLIQGGVPQEIAQQLIQMVMQQVQGGGAEGGQEGMGGGEPNGVQQPQAPAGPEQGMQGMPMPGGMARGGMTTGWEGEVTMQQLNELRKKGVKFDII